MRRLLKICTFLCLFIALPASAFEGDYILEERFQAQLFKAKDGEVEAQYVVGEMYQRGRGTRANDEDALYWYLLAARRGNLKAAYKAAYIYLHSSTVPQSPRKAVPWLKISAKSGNPAAQYVLGVIYGSGLAGHWDSIQALTLLAKAKLAGYKPAKKAFDRVVTKVVKLKTRPSSPVPKTSKPANVPDVQLATKRFRPNVTKSLSNPKQMILARRWDSNNGPSTFLPSYITDCREHVTHIECLSNKLTKQVSNARVVYRIRTRITEIQDNGQFRLAYANNVLSATKDSGARVMNVKTGWQLDEYTMKCSLDAGREISCSRRGSEPFLFSGH